MKYIQASAILLCLALAVTCCNGCAILTPAIDGLAVRPLALDVVQMHDGYVMSDIKLPLEMKAAYLAQSKAFLDLFSAPEVAIAANAPLANLVCNRTRDYILDDPTGPPGSLQSRVYLRSVDRLQDLFSLE